jgi:hypothetical protein
VSGTNHALVGEPPYELRRYRGWLAAIAELDGSFDPGAVAR